MRRREAVNEGTGKRVERSREGRAGRVILQAGFVSQARIRAQRRAGCGKMKKPRRARQSWAVDEVRAGGSQGSAVRLGGDEQGKQGEDDHGDEHGRFWINHTHSSGVVAESSIGPSANRSFRHTRDKMEGNMFRKQMRSGISVIGSGARLRLITADRSSGKTCGQVASHAAESACQLALAFLGAPASFPA